MLEHWRFFCSVSAPLFFFFYQRISLSRKESSRDGAASVWMFILKGCSLIICRVGNVVFQRSHCERAGIRNEVAWMFFFKICLWSTQEAWHSGWRWGVVILLLTRPPSLSDGSLRVCVHNLFRRQSLNLQQTFLQQILLNDAFYILWFFPLNPMMNWTKVSGTLRAPGSDVWAR